MRATHDLLALILIAVLTGAKVHAACTSPTGVAGTRQYNSTSKNFDLCDGTNWVPFKKYAATVTTCSFDGRLDWNTGTSAYQICDGSNYYKVSPVCVPTLTYKNKITDATNMQYANSIVLSNDGKKAFVVGQYSQRVTVLDTSNPPAAPTVLGNSATTAYLDDSQSIAVYGNYLFAVGRGSSNMVAFNVSTNTPTYMGRVVGSPASEMNNIWSVDVRPDGKYAFTISWAAGASSDRCFIHAIDVANPASMTIAGKMDLTTISGGYVYCNKLKIKGNIAYITDASDAIHAIDISDPTAMIYLNTTTNSNMSKFQGFDFTKDGNYVVGTTFENAKFNVVDISNPSALTWKTQITNATDWSYSYHVKVVGDYAFVSSEQTDATTIVDITAPLTPVMGAVYTSSANLDGAQEMAIFGRYMYQTSKLNSTVSVFDLGCDPMPTISQGACTGNGKVEYFPTTRALTYCTSSNYAVMAQPDVTPAPVDWPNFTDNSQSRTIYQIMSSIELQFATATVAGSPTVQYRLNGGAWTTFTTGTPASVTVNDGTTVEFRTTGTTGDISTITVTNLSTGGTVLDTMRAYVGNPCPTNYVLVPYLAGYTTQDFCIAKYEAKQSGSIGVSVAAGTPWGGLSRTTALSACTANGTGYDLITNDEWQTVARNIENTAWNWSSGVVGSGTLNRGHTDNSPASGLAAAADTSACSGTGQSCSDTVWDAQRRTNKLSNGGVIWDFGGNYCEWVKDTNSTNFGTNTYISQYTDSGTTGAIGGVTRNRKGHFGSAGLWTALGSTAYGGFGQGLTNYSNGGIVRGSSYVDNAAGAAGIFRVGLDNATSATWTGFGARCVYHP